MIDKNIIRLASNTKYYGLDGFILINLLLKIVSAVI